MRLRLRQAAAILVLLSVFTVASSLVWVRAASAGRVYALQDVPARSVAMVLGAEVYTDGTPSAFLAARLAMASGRTGSSGRPG